MASGYGLNGGTQVQHASYTSVCQSPHAVRCELTWAGVHGAGVSRCFPFWQELLACYVVNSAGDGDTSGKVKCLPVLEDYYECLHHKKEVRLPRLDQAPHLGRMG